MARLLLMWHILEEADRQDKLEARKRQRKKKLIRLGQSIQAFTDAALALNDVEFIKKYCLSKNLYLNLVEQLTPLMKKRVHRTDITIKCKILIALAFYATGVYENQNNWSFLSKQSVLNSIKEVTEALNHESILNAHDQFPASIEERNKVKAKFEANHQMPGILGCIGGTHVAMVKPIENEEQYLNKDQYYSLNIQIVCDYDLNILTVDTRYGGAYSFNQHHLQQYFKDLICQGETVCLLGNSGYCQQEYMMTPIIYAPENSREEFYNKTHASAMDRIQKTIALLKARWKCLMKDEIVLPYRPEMVGKIVNACCLLHNICNRAQISAPSDFKKVQELVAYEQFDNTDRKPLDDTTDDELQKAFETRQRLVNALWKNSRFYHHSIAD